MEMMHLEYHAPSKCPVCKSDMELMRLRCKSCGTELSGSFSPCRFCALEEKHMTFIEAFLRSRGSIKEVEKALGVSYPTVKNMLEAALTALGYAAGPAPSRKDEILAKLERGELDVSAALEKLKEI